MVTGKQSWRAIFCYTQALEHTKSNNTVRVWDIEPILWKPSRAFCATGRLQIDLCTWVCMYVFVGASVECAWDTHRAVGYPWEGGEVLTPSVFCPVLASISCRARTDRACSNTKLQIHRSGGTCCRMERKGIEEGERERVARRRGWKGGDGGGKKR